MHHMGVQFVLFTLVVLIVLIKMHVVGMRIRANACLRQIQELLLFVLVKIIPNVLIAEELTAFFVRVCYFEIARLKFFNSFLTSRNHFFFLWLERLKPCNTWLQRISSNWISGDGMCYPNPIPAGSCASILASCDCPRIGSCQVCTQQQDICGWYVFGLLRLWIR